MLIFDTPSQIYHGYRFSNGHKLNFKHLVTINFLYFNYLISIAFRVNFVVNLHTKKYRLYLSLVK